MSAVQSLRLWKVSAVEKLAFVVGVSSKKLVDCAVLLVWVFFAALCNLFMFIVVLWGWDLPGLRIPDVFLR